MPRRTARRTMSRQAATKLRDAKNTLRMRVTLALLGLSTLFGTGLVVAPVAFIV